MNDPRIHIPLGDEASEASAKPVSCGCGHNCGTPVSMPSAHAADDTVGGERTVLHIAQMDCPVEEMLLRDTLSRLAGVHELSFDLVGRILTVVHAPGVAEAVLAAIRSLGFTPEAVRDARAAPRIEASRASLLPIVTAGVLAIASEAAHWFAAPTWLTAVLALGAVLACGTGTYRKGWIALRHGALNINALMSIAVTGALLIGQWPEAAMVMVLFTIAEMIEARSLDRARRAIGDLMALAPQVVTLLGDDGQWRQVAAAGVPVGSRVRVRPGERIALDGTVAVGHSTINQAPITGESLPIEKSPGDGVYAGTINLDGEIECLTTALADDSTLARIIHAVEQAQSERAPTQRFVDRFARVYTPAVCVFALALAVLPPLLGLGAWLDWIYRALVLLVIACPCALVISTPVAIVSALTAAARRGVLIKGGVYLERGADLRVLALDKTGTVTRGVPAQTGMEPWHGADGDAVQMLAASLAARSDHPVSQAVARHTQTSGVTLCEVDGFAALPGRGVRGSINGELYHLGNARLMNELGVVDEALAVRLDELGRSGASIVMLADAGGVKALFSVTDTVREGAREVIAALRGLGVDTCILSGDGRAVVEAVAREVDVKDARGELLPQDKLDVVAALAQKGAIGMVGDGINDAPALARADIGFAMAAAGTDTAMETADVALMDDELAKLPYFIRLSRATRRVLAQNIMFAIAIKVLFLALTVAGVGTLWMAVFADVGASLIVVGNSLRLTRAARA